MMKISKSVLLNEPLISHVQFTSLNSVLFKNVQTVYDGSEKIILEYEYQSKIDVSSRDWIGIFPRGWNTLQQYVTFEWVSPSLSCGVDQNKENHAETVCKTITFCPKYHINAVNPNFFYQFVYVSKQIEVLGVSSYFRFDLSNVNEAVLELECLVPVSARLRSTSFSDFGALLTANNESSSTSLANRALHATSIHSLQNLNWTKSTNAHENQGDLLYKKPPLPSGTGDALDPYVSHSEPGFPMSLQMNQCKKCLQFKKGGDLLRSQQILQSKLKIVMERNKILEKRAQDMKKEMERLQSDSKTMKMSFYHLNKEKVAYEKFVKDLIKSLEKDSFVRVMNGNTEILVKKVNYVGMEEHPRDKKTSKRERELKAVIGLQEITIRNLINNLQEKAKSVQDLNQTIKLAQAFSAAAEDPRDAISEVDESTEEIGRSEATSEYEFSLTRPQPPEELPVDTDSVLDDIRRTTETELKDIGIDRSLGECSSKDSESEFDVANLTIVGYPNEQEKPVTEAKSVENMQCEWSFEPESEKANENFENDGCDLELETEKSVYEDYFDACDAFSVRSELNTVEEKRIFEQESKPEEFLMTAIVPKNHEIKPATPLKSVGETEDKVGSHKGKKFTCEFSIDFAAIRPKSQERKADSTSSVAESQSKEKSSDDGSQICTLKRENSLITFKKSEKCLEIEITQENSNKNCIHQKMVVKFGNNEPKVTEECDSETEQNNDKSELNLALNSSEEKEEEKKSDAEASEKSHRSSASKSSSVRDEETDPGETSRTVWNDATDLPDLPEVPEIQNEKFEENTESEQSSPRRETEESNETTSEASEEPDQTMLSDDSINNFKIYQDSLRYEKNLEFLQKKNEEKLREEETVKEKPSAILIQNGTTKVALIRYQ